MTSLKVKMKAWAFISCLLWTPTRVDADLVDALSIQSIDLEGIHNFSGEMPRLLLDNLNATSPSALDMQAFLQDDLDFGKDDFICDEVAEIMTKLIKPGRRRLKEEVGSNHTTSPYKHEAAFACVVDPIQTSTGTHKGLHLELKNVGPSFASERKEAIAKKKTRLIVRNPRIEGSTLIVPDQTDSIVDGVMSFTSVLEWQEPPKGSVSKARSRRLATGQSGTKSVVILRITAVDGISASSVPTKTAQEVLDSVFGFDNSDEVNLRTQYQACSYDLLKFEPADGGNLTSLYATSGVVGVVDITVTVDTPFQTTDIELQAIEKAENSTADGGLALDLDEYDHVMLMVPPGSWSKGSPFWVAYAYKVSIVFTKTLHCMFLMYSSYFYLHSFVFDD